MHYLLKDAFLIEKSFAIVAVDEYLINKNQDEIFENSKKRDLAKHCMQQIILATVS